MSGRDLIAPNSTALAEPSRLSDEARDIGRDQISRRTQITYRNMWSTWETHCRARGLTPLPADVIDVSNWLAQRLAAGGRVVSARVALSAIMFRHRAAGLAFDKDHRVIRAVLAGAERREVRPPDQAQPLDVELVGAIMRDATPGAGAIRDRALIALLYLFGMRASELVGLDWAQVGPGGTGVLNDAGLALHLHRIRGKTIKQGLGQRAAVSVDTSPATVAAVRAWIACMGAQPGAAIAVRVRKGDQITTDRLQPQAITAILQQTIKRARVVQGWSQAAARTDALRYSSHSGRRGLITSAREAGLPIDEIADHVGHTDVNTTRRYGSASDALKRDVTRAKGVGV